MTRSRHILPPRRFWTEAEDEILRREYPDRPTVEIAALLRSSLPRINSRATVLGLKKTAQRIARSLRELGGRLQASGRANRFPKVNVPWNTGLRRPGYSIGRGRMRETQFKKRQMPHNWIPIGSLTVSKEGYIIRKMREPGDGLRGAQCYRQEHILIWEKVNGPIPPKHRLAFRDGDKRNLSLENLELVTFAEMMRRNTIHVRRSPEQKRAIYALIALKRKISKLEGKWQTTSRKSEKSCSTRSVESPRRNSRWRSTGRKRSAV